MHVNIQPRVRRALFSTPLVLEVRILCLNAQSPESQYGLDPKNSKLCAIFFPGNSP